MEKEFEKIPQGEKRFTDQERIDFTGQGIFQEKLQASIKQLQDRGIMPVVSVQGTRFKNHFNTEEFPDEGEVNTLPSETVPDQSMSIRELVYRYTHGLSLGGGKVPVFDSEDDIQYPENWDKLDLSEKHDFFREKAIELQELQDQLKVRQNKIIEEQRQKEVDEAVAKKLKAIRDIRNPKSDEEQKTE